LIADWSYPFSGRTMNIHDTTLKILTLGRFSVSYNGKPVVGDWPDETMKVFFCSLISPLDLYLTWDRLCRSMLGVPETRASRRQLEELLIRPLNSFLIRELGFTPLVAVLDSISINQKRIYVDAREFHSAVVEGLRLQSLGEHAAARIKLDRARSLYAGDYLPGINGKIITNTRHELESLYRTATIESAQTVSHTNSPISPARSGSVDKDFEISVSPQAPKSFPAGK
jgi:hypothetical protein